MPRGFETLAPLPCLSSPHFSRVSLQSWGTPLAGEAEGLRWGLQGPGVGAPTSYFSPSPGLCSPQPRGGNGGPPSGPSKLLPATRPKQACGGPGFHIWHPSSAEEGDSAGGSPWAPCPPSPLAMLGSFLPQKQPQSPDPQRPGQPQPRGPQALGRASPLWALLSTSCSSSRLPCPSLPRSPPSCPPAELRFASCGKSQQQAAQPFLPHEAPGMEPLLCLGNLADARESVAPALAWHGAWGRTRAEPGSPL